MADPNRSLDSAIEEIRRAYRGHAPGDAKPAIVAALKEHGRTVPDDFVDMMADAVTNGDALTLKFDDA